MRVLLSLFVCRKCHSGIGYHEQPVRQNISGIGLPDEMEEEASDDADDADVRRHAHSFSVSY